MADIPAGFGNTVADENRRGYKAAGLLGGRGLLVVLSGPRLGQSRVIGSAPVVVGRQSDCDLAIDDPLLSRQHFRVSVSASVGVSPPEGPSDVDFLLEDLDSKNSTYLNTKPLTGPARLHYGDRILAGGTIFRFLLEEEAEKRGGRPRG